MLVADRAHPRTPVDAPGRCCWRLVAPLKEGVRNSLNLLHKHSTITDMNCVVKFLDIFKKLLLSLFAGRAHPRTPVDAVRCCCWQLVALANNGVRNSLSLLHK